MARAEQNTVASMEFIERSAIAETTSMVFGDKLRPLESVQHFEKTGITVRGGTASARVWDDKSFIPITINTMCIDCLHCVVACPHSAIGHEVTDRGVGALESAFVKLAAKLPGWPIDTSALGKDVRKGITTYNHCKGCFVCATACPTGAIRFVPQDQVLEAFDGRKIDPSEAGSIYRAPEAGRAAQAEWLVGKAKELDGLGRNTEKVSQEQVTNGSDMLGEFIFQARFDHVSIFPITPNSKVMSFVESRVRKPRPGDHTVNYRSTLSEEAGYAYLTGAGVRGERALLAQGSQSLAQIYEFLNINPGLHIPVFLLELTRALNPGTSIKPDHTTTMRTSDTGEIVVFGRSLQQNYDRGLVLLKTMESDSVWIPGRLVVKGFVETHTLATERQNKAILLTQDKVDAFLGRQKNPYVFDGQAKTVGVLDFDSRYMEQRVAGDRSLNNAHLAWDEAARRFAEVSGRPAPAKVNRFPATGDIDLAIVALDDPELQSAELVAEELRKQGIKAGVISICLYRPFPANELNAALVGVKAVTILEFDNWGGRSGGGVLAQEVRGALYQGGCRAPVTACIAGLGGRAVSISYFVAMYRVLADLAAGPQSPAAQWLATQSSGSAYILGARGIAAPPTGQTFDIPMLEPGVRYVTIVGRGGQGLMLLNSVLVGLLARDGRCANSMAAYGALQRGGGISLSLKVADKPVRDASDIIVADTIVSFNADRSLDAMLPQLIHGGSLIVDCDLAQEARLRELRPDARIVALPARALARTLVGNPERINLVFLGALVGELGISSPARLLSLIESLKSDPEAGKAAALLLRPENRLCLLAGQAALDAPQQPVSPITQSATELARRSFVQDLLPAADLKALDAGEDALKSLRSKRGFLKKMYGKFFNLHPLISKVRGVYAAMGPKPPLSEGDMACPGCGQANIFRNIFNYLDHLHRGKGRMMVSEQDGCGTVFTSMNQASTWNIDFIRVAFETAHGVAAGLSRSATKDSGDLVISITGDGGFMQGIRSIEDSLHQGDPVLHIVVVNQALGNTGGQATATTMMGERTKEGHEAKNQPVNLLKYAEKYCVDAAQASTVHLADLYKKIEVAHDTVHRRRRPFMLLLNFSCLEQGMNLAYSMIAQKRALDGHFFTLYSLYWEPIRNMKGNIVGYRKKHTIDWFPWTFGRNAWKDKLKSYFSTIKIGEDIIKDEEKLDRVYWHLRGEWEQHRSDMGEFRYWLYFLKSFFSPHRATMARLIRKSPPPQADR